MSRRARTCWVSREQFLLAVGVVNAEITLTGQTTVKFDTQYPGVAERVAGLAKSIGAVILQTMYQTDGWRTHYVVSVKGFYHRPLLGRRANGGRSGGAVGLD